MQASHRLCKAEMLWIKYHLKIQVFFNGKYCMFYSLNLYVLG